LSGSLATTRPWYNLAAMHSEAATIASQKGNWKFPETKALMLAPIVRFDGKLRVVEPTIGTLMSSNPAMEVIINKPEMKVIRENSGFL